MSVMFMNPLNEFDSIKLWFLFFSDPTFQAKLCLVRLEDYQSVDINKI